MQRADPMADVARLSQHEEPQVVVIGAGVAGLSAALTLAEAGLAPLVLEADPDFCGGRLREQPPSEFEYEGRRWSFTGEHGIHGFWSQYNNLRALLDRFGIDPPLVWGLRQAWVYAEGGSVSQAEVGRRLRRSPLPAPFHFLSLLNDPGFLRMLGPIGLLRIPWVGIGLVTMLAIDPMKERDLVRNMYVRDFLFGWPDMLRAFAGALSRSGLSTGSEEVPISGFIALFRFYALLRRDAVGFQHLRGDPGASIIDPMLAALNKHGGRVVQGVGVTQLERREDGTWTVCWSERSNATGGEIRAEDVVLAVDASSARQLLSASPQLAPQAAAMAFPEGRATASVRLWFRTAPLTEAEGGMFGGDFILDNFFWLHMFQDAFIDWHQKTGGSAVECHIYGPPDLLEQTDATLLAIAVRDVVKAFPELRGQLVHGALQRNPATHTLFYIGAASRHLGVVTPWPGLYCCGDWVRLDTPSLFLERSCVTGITAANEVLTVRGKPPAPLLAYPPTERTAAILEVALRDVRRVFEAAARLVVSR